MHPAEKGGLDQMYEAIFRHGGPDQGQQMVAAQLEAEGLPVFQPGKTAFSKPFDQAWQMATSVVATNQAMRLDTTDADQIWDIVDAVDERARQAAEAMVKSVLKGKKVPLSQASPEVVAQVKRNVNRRAELMKRVLLATYGGFGFGGDYRDQPDTYIEQRGGGKGSSIVKLRADHFSSGTIARDFNLAPRDVADMIEDATYKIANLFIDPEAGPREQIPGTRLAIRYLVPKPITNAFYTANANALIKKQPVPYDDPVAQAGIFVQKLGSAIKKRNNGDRAGQIELELLQKETRGIVIPDDVFDTAVRDISSGLKSVSGQDQISTEIGATYRAFLAIEEVDPNILSLMSKGKAVRPRDLREEDAAATPRRQILASLDDIWSGYERILGDLSSLVGANL